MYNDIEKRNEAIELLKNFVKLSSVLLPYYAQLNSKRKLTGFEVNEKKRLESIYNNYEASSYTSMALINSNVLSLIKNTYFCLNVNPKSSTSRRMLRQFLKEWNRLQKTWQHHSLN